MVQRLTPLSIKLATVVGMGLLIALIGMVSIHLVVPDPQTVVALGTRCALALFLLFSETYYL